MQQRTLNLGILAHVDAGKTTLTERLLFAAGVIGEIGSVDAGTTQTDSLALERQRGITIRSAVASFAIGDVAVNLIDTPGHPDFIAEVERVLTVLDGAVLVISAVEGVQPQTRILHRALARLRIPALLFVNKVDRPGAAGDRVLRAISERLTPAVVPMGRPSGLGTAGAGFQPWPTGDLAAEARMAEVLAEQDERVLTAYVEDEAGLSGGRLRRELAAATRRAAVHPVFFGSAITGAGTQALMDGIVELLPSAVGDAGAPAAGSVFKIERGPGGEKIAYARMFAGTVRARDRLGFGSGAPGGGRPGGVPGGPERTGKVTAIAVFERGPAQQRPAVEAGQIAKLWGLDPVQVGDQLWRVAAAGRARPAKAGEHGTGPAPGQPGRWQRGGRQERRAGHQFARPTLASVVEASQPGDRARLRAALGQLAEQDPLINVRQDDALGEISVSLYGEVQKEVIQATLASDFGVDARFRETTTVYIERPAGTGEAAEVMHGPQNPFPATLGLRVEPAPAGTGIAFRMAVELRSVPLYVFKTTGSFAEAMALNVRHALQEGLSGWEVTDAVVTLTQSGYISPSTTAAHFRKLTPLVLAGALAEAGTVVCEPLVRVSAEVPADTAGAVLAAAARLGGAAQATPLRPGLATVTATLPAARAQDLQRQLPGLTNGEGVAETSPGGYRPVAGTPPVRRRTMPNPLNREEYLVHLTRPAALRPSGH